MIFFRKPVSTPDQVRGRLFRDHALGVAAALLGVNLWRQAQLYVSTDNAQIQGEPVQVGSMNAGRVDAVNVKVGTRVDRGAVLARVALPSAVA